MNKEVYHPDNIARLRAQGDVKIDSAGHAASYISSAYAAIAGVTTATQYTDSLAARHGDHWRACRLAAIKSRSKRNEAMKRFAIDRRGVTAIEYGIIAGVLGLVLVLVFQRFGVKLTGLFSTIGHNL